VEEIAFFGSDVGHQYLTTGNSAQLEEMRDFYHYLLEHSTLKLQDIKPGNIGKRADGTWIITDWAFNLGYGQRGQSIEGKISPTELAVQIVKGTLEGFDQEVKRDPGNKKLYGDRALALSGKLLTELHLPVTSLSELELLVRH
jgi:hypothetical protein